MPAREFSRLIVRITSVFLWFMVRTYFRMLSSTVLKCRVAGFLFSDEDLFVVGDGLM